MTTELTTIPTLQNELALPANTFVLHPEMERYSAMWAKSTMIPDAFRNNPSNCMIALDIALRLQTSPLMVMQNLYIVNNKPSWSGQFLIACINKSGMFKTPIRFKFSGKEGTDDYGCVAYVIDKNGEMLESTKITIGMAKKEGWWSKKSKETKAEISKWQSMPEHMMRFRAASFFARTYCPEVTMGLMTQEEVFDITAPVPSSTPPVYVPDDVVDVRATPLPPPEIVPPTPAQDVVIDVPSPSVTPTAPANNLMWKDSVGDMPAEFDREAEIANVRRLASEGYFTQVDVKDALKLYGTDRISNLADDAFESLVLGHIRLVEQTVDETTKRNIPRAKLNEFARSDNEHSFFVSSIATKRKILSLIVAQTIPQQGN